MNIQIFGMRKCFDTQKTERYFKERNIKYQFIDLDQKSLSKGELNSIKQSIILDDLINQKAKDYTRLNMNKIGKSSMREEILLNNPQLFKTPVVRNGKLASVGYQPEIWNEWC